MLYGIFLYGTLVYLEAASTCLVRYSHNSDDAVTCLYEFFERSYCKLRSTHVYDSCLFGFAHNL